MLRYIWLLALPAFLCGQQTQLQKELELINAPAKRWLIPHQDSAVLDVAIIGGGMSGAAAAFALTTEGIRNIKIFDENPLGFEGPWLRYARMPTLRSLKSYMGPAYGVPSLTFRAWFEAQHGEEEWKLLDKIPTEQWSHYLQWYRTVLNLPSENSVKLTWIEPYPNYLELTFENETSTYKVKARKVVLATGRDGSGGCGLPSFATNLPARRFAHTNETIAPEILKGKNVSIIGCGASAFDAAAFAIESGAKQVEMLVRRSTVPQVNKFALFFHPGIIHGFHKLSDAMRCRFVGEALEWGIPPPKTALARLEGNVNFHIHYCTTIDDIAFKEDHLEIYTNRGTWKSDFIIFATGFEVDLAMRDELAGFVDQIDLWKEHVPVDLLAKLPKLGRFPYLGDHFQFQEKETGQAPWLKDIYCFNYGAMLSLGLLAADIPGISAGARRLAEGIAADFFLENQDAFFDEFRGYDHIVFECNAFEILEEDETCILCE